MKHKLCAQYASSIHGCSLKLNVLNIVINERMFTKKRKCVPKETTQIQVSLNTICVANLFNPIELWSIVMH